MIDAAASRLERGKQTTAGHPGALPWEFLDAPSALTIRAKLSNIRNPTVRAHRGHSSSCFSACFFATTARVTFAKCSVE